MPPTTLTPAARHLKQCQNCFKSDSKATPLQSCSGCKRAHYCSAACQKADWENHKLNCKRQSEMHTAMKEDPIVSNAALSGLSIAKVESVVHKWIQKYKPLLTITTFSALDLRNDLERGLTHVLSIELSPTFTAQKLPRKDAEISRAFNLTGIDIFGTEELIQSAPGPMKATIIVPFTRMVEQTKAVREKDASAVGFSMVMVRVPACKVMKIVPLGTDERQSQLPVYDPTWRETLETRIGQGHPL